LLDLETRLDTAIVALMGPDAFRRMHGKCIRCGGYGYFYRVRPRVLPGAMLTRLVRTLCRYCGGSRKSDVSYDGAEERLWRILLRHEQ
jgi:hypothetical protein